MILLPLEKGAGGILKQTTFHTQVTFGNENFMLGESQKDLLKMPERGMIKKGR